MYIIEHDYSHFHMEYKYGITCIINAAKTRTHTVSPINIFNNNHSYSIHRHTTHTAHPDAMATTPRSGNGGGAAGSGGAGAAQRPNGTAQGKICQFKMVLLGESAVGKSSLVLRFVKGLFHEYQESTIGAAFLTQTVCIDDTAVKFEIWDTAGQERFVYLILQIVSNFTHEHFYLHRYHSLAPMYYRGAQAAIVVYDIQNQDSFQRAKTWVKELQRQVSYFTRCR